MGEWGRGGKSEGSDRELPTRKDRGGRGLPPETRTMLRAMVTWPLYSKLVYHAICCFQLLCGAESQGPVSVALLLSNN